MEPEAWLRWSAHPLGEVLCAEYSAFAPGSSQVAVSALAFWYLVAHNLHALF